MNTRRLEFPCVLARLAALGILATAGLAQLTNRIVADERGRGVIGDVYAYGRALSANGRWMAFSDRVDPL